MGAGHYFPDYADGGGWSVQLAISNINTTENAAVLVVAYDREGEAIEDFFGYCHVNVPGVRLTR